MQSGFFERAEHIFHEAAALPPGQRSQYLSQACGEDAALRREVESLLAASESSVSLLDDSPFAGLAAPVQADEDGAMPERIGSHRLVRKIGQGGMGAVYEGIQESTDRRVAIKLIRPSMANQVFVRRFKNEQRILAALEHPGIARLYDASTTDTGVPYLAMEFVDGHTVVDFCAERQLSIEERVQLFERICEAVQHAHQHLIVHRDLKPSNILITRDGEPKLLDFGIAKLLDSGGDSAIGATVTGLRLMTPEYASPEQIRGEPVTTASDVYSLGVVLYELLTNRRLYRVTSRKTHEIERAVLEQSPSRPSSAVLREEGEPVQTAWSGHAAPRKHAALLRGDLDNIVLRALDKDPARRYATVDELKDDLRRHRSGLPVRARPDSVAYRSRKFIARHRWSVATAGAVAAALIVALVVTVAAAAEARRERDRAARRFDDVRQLANVFLFDVDEKIRDIAGATAARELLVKTGLTYLDRLASDAVGDPALLREVANGYDRLGDVQGGLLISNLGQSNAALDSYQKASTLRAQLTAGDGGTDSELLRETARGELKYAEALVRVGKMKEAPVRSARAVQLLASARTTGDATEDTRQRAEALVRHGFNLAVTDDMPGAIATYREAIALYEGLPEATLSQANIGRGHAFGLFRLVQALGTLPDPAARAEALSLTPRLIAIDRKLLAGEPHRADLRRGLSRDLAKLGDLLGEAGRHEEAVAAYGEATDVFQRDVALDPQDRLARRNVATVAARRARSLLALGRAAEVRAMLQPLLSDITRILDEDPRNITVQVTFAEVAVRLAEAELKLGRFDATSTPAVRASLDRTVSILEPLVVAKTLVGGDAAVLTQAKHALAAWPK